MILHLALASDWDTAVAAGSYRVSTRGLTLDEVGFIHCSTPAQVEGVAARFYADITEPLLVLVLNADAVREAGTDVRFEGGDGENAEGGELFPHIYGPIDPDWVIEARPAAMIDGALVVG